MRHSGSTLKLRLKRRLFRPLFALSSWLQRWLPKRPAPPIERSALRRIGILQLGGRGDLLRVFPLIQILSEACPAAELLVLTDQSRSLLALLPTGAARCGYVHLDLGQGYPAKLRQALRLRRQGLDLLIVPARGDGILESAVLSLLLGRGQRIGFDLEGSGLLYTHSLAFRMDRPILQQNVDILSLIGLTARVDQLDLRIPEEARRAARTWLGESTERRGRLLAIHPWVSAEPGFRAWPTRHHAALVRRLLVADPDLRILLLGGAGDRARADRHFGGFDEPRLLDLTGRVDFVTSCALLDGCDLLLAQDSSLLHVAEALGVPSVALFGATSPVQVLPPVNRCQVIQTSARLPCQPCYRHQAVFDWVCRQGYACLEGIGVDEVMAVIQAALHGPLARSPGRPGQASGPSSRG